MAYEFYVTIIGSTQGIFSGESRRDAHQGKVAGLAFHYEVKSAREAATGQATGKRQHSPVTFTKEWGAATPQIFQALVTNEHLTSVLFEFIQTTPDGTEEVYYTLKLTNATVSNLKQYVTGTHELALDSHELEEVSFTFQRIEIENQAGKTMAMDDWTMGRSG